MDCEQSLVPNNQLVNTTIHNITWKDVSVSVKDRITRKPKAILQNITGLLEAGEFCALMGPSGSGKTTLLNILAKRPAKNKSIEGNVLINGRPLTPSEFRNISCFVEQRDAFIGALTVSETLSFTSRLARRLGKNERLSQIQGLLKSFGLIDQADTLVGTPLRQGISDGQKRRLAVVKQLITSPKILFLDEPTSGLDAAASFEVVNYLRILARRNKLIVVCSIHQPSISTFNLFDKLLLISSGKPHYFGPLANVAEHYKSVGIEISTGMNPADFLLELVNTDFSKNRTAATRQLDDLQSAWEVSVNARELCNAISNVGYGAENSNIELINRPGMGSRIMTLLYRAFVRSYRDPMAYGFRLAFSVVFAVLIGTMWQQLDHDQDSIRSLTSEIYFTISFQSLSTIIYGPVLIEDYMQSIQDFRNGLYGVSEFVLANFLISVPFNFLSSLIFSFICYWSSDLLSTVSALVTWILWIFLTSLAAESLVAFVVSIYPDFVFTVGCASFLNALLLCTQGFFISYSKLNVFYKYAFHYWDFLAYSFEGLMNDQFVGVTYSCGANCRCIYESELADRCQIPGEVVLNQYGYNANGQLGRNVGIVIGITLGYRLASWIFIRLRI